jgi:predicted transcriptional regulator
MRENGVRAVTGTCEACRREADVNVNALPESVTVPKGGQRLRCSSCGGKTIIDQAGMTYGPARWCFRKRRLDVGQSDGAIARHGATLPEQEPTTRSPEVLITRRGDRRRPPRIPRSSSIARSPARTKTPHKSDAKRESEFNSRGIALKAPIDEPTGLAYECERQSGCRWNSSMAKSNPVELAAEIVSAFISYNPVPKGELPTLIHSVHSAVERLERGPEGAPPRVEAKAPAVPIRRSITPDFLICLEDGKRFKTMRRHLAGLGLTPEQYREKWDLPSDYPMVAPNYAAQRSALAKKIGLGQLGGKARTRRSNGRSKAAKA